MTRPSLYIHIPFCEKKCFFCSFAVAVNQAGQVDGYLQALEHEAGRYRGRETASIYIGGGTPSFLSADQTRRLFDLVDRNFLRTEGAEVTFECNPESVTAEKAEVLMSRGVTRVSLGVQSMDDSVLAYLGRPHRAVQARQAFDLLRDAGFRNISVDLMYGFQGQRREDIDRDLEAVTAFGSEHMAIYALSVEERSLFFSRKEKAPGSSEEDLYQHICEALEGKGFSQYEISNFSRPGFESRHNMNYWQGGEYVGLGMAAHSHLDGRRFWNADTLPQYLAAISRDGSAVVGEESLPEAEKMMEAFLFGLRMNRGVDLGELSRRFGMELPEEKREALENFIELGLLEEDGMIIRTSARGRMVLDEISARLV